MTLNKQTLEEAEQVREQLLDLQHKTETARVDYHHLIRQLHAKGGSLREIAEALGLSHQRVHQIVEPDGGPGPRGPRHGHRHGPGGPGYGPPGPPFGQMQRLARRLRAFPGFEHFTEGARAAIAQSVEDAGELGHRRVGTEHLVLALSGSPTDSVTGKALAAVGVTRARVHEALAATLHMGAPGPGRRPFTPALRRVLHGAVGIAREAGGDTIEAEHLLLAVVADGGDGAALLAGLGADGPAVTAAVDAARGN